MKPKEQTVAHIIVPPEGGVHDYAYNLQEALGIDKFCLVCLSKKNVAAWKISPAEPVLLQLSGYGYSRRGAPLWLLREIERQRKAIKCLGVFFHELYAFGPPWTTSFWLSPVQRYIARRLAELSDFWMTNREDSATWLRKYAGDRPNSVLPVFSNVGELAAPAPHKLPRIIVFGSAALRKSTYYAAGEKLFAWAGRGGLEIHDIGAPIKDGRLDKVLQANGVVKHGKLDKKEISVPMRDALYGLLAYPVEVVAKSSVFAAYCAHSLCPILISKNYMQTDGLIAGRHYLPGIPDIANSDEIDSVRKAAWGWYQPHNISAHAAAFRSLVEKSFASI